jgi:hypothetical protein
MQQAFDKSAEINDISVIQGATSSSARRRHDRDQLRLREAGPADEQRHPAVIDYDGTTDPSGVVAAKAD